MESVSRKDARGVSNSRPINPNKAQRQGKSERLSSMIIPIRFSLPNILLEIL